MAKNRRSDDVMLPLTIGVLLIMAVTVVILQFFLRQGTPDDPTAALQPDDFSQLVSDVLPDDNVVLSALQPQLPTEELRSAEYQFAGRDSFQIPAYVSKPEGNGPFPAIVLIHDAPSSARSAQRLSATVGERLSQEQSAIVLSVDWKEGSQGQDDLSDIVSAIDWIEQTPQQSGQQTIVLGIGYGAYLGFLATAETDADGMMSVSGYHDPEAVLNAIEKEKPKKEKETSVRGQQFLTSMGCDTVASAQACLEQLSASDALLNRPPSLLIHNVIDPVIPIGQLETTIDLLNPDTTTVHRLEIDEPQHDMLATAATAGFEETMALISTWLSDQLDQAEALDPSVEVIAPTDNASENTPTPNNDAPRDPIFIEVDGEELIEKARSSDS